MTSASTMEVRRGTSRSTVTRAVQSAAASSVVSYAVNLLVLPLVLRRLGVEIYGAWAVLASLLAIAGLADAGVRTEIVRRVGHAQGTDDREGVTTAVQQGLTILLASAGLLVTIGWLSAPLLQSAAFPHGVGGVSATSLTWFVRAVFGLLAASIVGNGYFGVLRGVQRSDIEATATMIAVPIGAAATLAAVFAGWRLSALIFGSACQLLAQFGWQAVMTRRVLPWLHPRAIRLSRNVVRGYLALSGLALLSQVSDVVDSQWDKIVLVRFVGPPAVASFQICTSLVLQGKMVALLPLTPLLAGVAELRSRSADEVDRLYRSLERSATVVSATALSTIFVFGPSLLRLWLGVPLLHSTSAVRLFTLAVAANLACAPLAYRAFAEGLHHIAAIGSVTNMVINGAVSLAATAALGFNGALYGSIVGNVCGALVFFALMHRRLPAVRVLPPIRVLAVAVAGTGLAMIAGAGRIDQLPLLVGLAAAFAVVIAFAAARSLRMNVRSIWDVKW